MLYENYRKKIIKVADILKTVRKFRVLIITFLIALLCVMAVLLGIQGVVFDMSTPPAVIVYGQPFEYEAGAVMGSVRYEYAEEGSDEWTAAQPVRAGSYKVRAVAKGAFGGDRYGAEHSFTIEPKPIDVTLAESSAVYGEQPLLTADLAYSDVIRCVAFSYDYSQAEADISEGTEIRVFDENGEDVTSSYTFRSVEGTLLIEQRAVAITTDSAEKVYDGTPLTDTGYTVSADTPLAENDSVYIDDEADLTVQATITAAGSVENSLAFFFKKSITVDGEELFVDVTSNYAQEITYGTLTVKKRPVTFETASQSWVYDGEAHSNGGHVIAEGEGEYGLLNGHMMAVDESTLPQATEAGEVQNAFTIRIESAGEDMTDNYDVTYSYGTLTIKPRPVIFVTEGHEWVYDGTAHSWGGHSVAESAEEEYGLVEGHASAAVGFTYVTNVADSGTANALTVAVNDGERDVTGNYAISYDEENAGKLTIKPRSVTFVTEGHEWVYDGEAHSWGGHSVAQGSENGLAEGHTSEAVAFTYVTDVADSGAANALMVAVYDGAEDVTANYEIAYDADGAGILTVMPRAVVIATATDEKVYDGTPLENGGCFDSGKGTYELVEGHRPVRDGAGTLPSVTDVLYDEAQHVIGLENIFAVRILDADDTDRTDNYAIGYDYGTLTVTPRAVVIATATDKKVYDGTPLENGGCFDSGKGTYELVEGHSPVWDGNGTLPSVTDVLYEDGKVVGMENAFAVRILDADGTDRTDNYAVGYDYGTLTVTPRPITVRSDSAEKVYDAASLTAHGCEITEGTLAAEQTLTADYTGSVTNVWESAEENNLFTVTIRDAAENNVTANYAVTYEYGTLTIKPRPIVVTAASGEKVYDAEPFGTDDFVGGEYYLVASDADPALDPPVVAGQTLAVETQLPESADVYEGGAHTLTPEDVTVWAGGTEVTANYAIRTEDGTVSIKPRTVTFVTESRSWVYDGEAHSWDRHAVAPTSEYGLVEGHTSRATELVYITDVLYGEDGDVAGIPNALVIEVYDADGAPVAAGNYSILYECGTLTVTPRPIVVTAASGEKVYDGMPFGTDDFAGGEYYLVASGADPALDPPVAAGQTLEVGTQLPESADVYESGAHTVVSVTVWADGTEVTKNYSIETADGTVTITPRPVLIATGSQTWVYDGAAHSNSESFAAPESDYADHDWGLYEAAVEAGECGLVTGHRSAWDEESELASITNVGSKKNIFMVRIADGAGKDVTGNYYIGYKYGSLTVTPRPILIKTATDEALYDGTAHGNGGHDWLRDAADYTGIFGSVQEGAFGLLETIGHSVLAKEETVPSFTDVRRSESGAVKGYENVFAVRIVSAEGDDVTKNYDVRYLYGTFTVTPRPVTFVTEGHEWVYDGTAHSWGGHVVAEGSAYGLVGEHTTRATGFTYVTNVADSGTVNELTVAVYDGERDVTGNYEISYDEENAGKLTIKPRPVTFETESRSWVYDGEAHSWDRHAVAPTSEYGLVEGHTSRATELVYITDVLYGEDGDVAGIPNALVIEVYDADGAPVAAGNYSILYEYGTLIITPRPIVVTAGSGEKVYDGMPFGHDDFTDGMYYLVASGADPALAPPVVAGQTLEVRTQLPESADVYESGAHTVVSVKVWADGTEVTANYSIRTEDGAVTIAPRPITVTAGSADKVYDGTPLTCERYDVTSDIQLVEGHTLTAKTVGSRTDVGSSPNEIDEESVTIVSADGRDVRKNYDVTCEAGTLVVTPRAITIVTGSKTWVYDGNAHSWYEDEEGTPTYYLAEGSTLADGQSMRVEDFTEITDAGSVENALTIGIYDEEGVSRTSNYTIGYDKGTLTVTKRSVTIVTEGHEWVYDGEAHSWDGHSVSEGSAYPLVNGHRTEVVSVTEITNVWESPVKNVLGIRIVDEDGNNVTQNYETDYEYGTLIITPRPIVVTAASGEKVYDGMPFGTDDFAGGEYYLVASGADPALEPPVAAGQTLEVGTQLPESADVYEGGAHTVVSVTVRADGTEVTANYAIETADGTVTIAPRPIVVTAASGEKVYDGEPLIVDTFTVSSEYEPPLVLDHYADVQVEGASATDVCENVPNRIVSVHIYAGDGTDVTGNYAVTTEDGTLTITPRPITVTAGSDTKVYYGTPLTCSEAIVSSALSPALVLDHEIRFAVSGSQTEIGESENTLTYAAVFTADGTDVSYNYQITKENGTLTVLVPGTLVVRTGGAEKIFDGTALTNAEYTIESTLGENFGMQFTVEVTCTGSQLHAGETENTADVRVTDASGKDVTEYTQIEYELGLLSVAPRPAKVVTGSQTWEYDGQAHSYPDETRIEAVEYDGVTYGLVQGHEAAFTDHAEIVMPGTMTNEVTVTVTDGGTIDFTDDYEFEYELGTLEIIDSSGGGGGGGAGDLDTSGELGGGALGGEGNATVLRVRADVSEHVYFRLLSFGNYNGGGWVYAPEYGQLLDGTYGMNYLTGIALSQAGYTSSQIAVEMYTNDYLLPDYMATGAGNYAVQTSDVWYKGDTSQVYSLPYYVYEYLENGAPTAGLGGYAAAEEAYRAFVYDNYLTVRESARACMQAIIAEQGFRADDPAIVAKVAAYIQNAAAYNLEYDRAMDDEADVVVAFLTKYKEGICQHYASAATLLFRELGIPARYTVGYVGETVAGEWAEIGAANAHAWVEVYIDGTGWVHVEVTGGGPGGGGGSGQQEEITIKPVNKTKQYDGTPLTADAVQGADEKSAMLLNELLTEGYFYKAEFAGSITEPGTTESTIENFVLYDPQGAEAENVTFTFEPGTLTVVSNILITIHPYVLQKYYDGTQLAYKADDYWVSGLQSGWRIEGFSMEGIGLTDVGAITADSDEILERLVGVRVYDESGILRTEGVDYTLVIDGSTLLTVDRRAITVSSYSDTKQYDGTPLTNDKCWISSGSLANGHIFEATVTGSITDVGTKQNTIGAVIIRDGDGNEVTKNYNIVFSPGWLTVLDG